MLLISWYCKISLANNLLYSCGSNQQRWSPKTQKNPMPRPRTAFPRTDTLEAKDRNARGPRTQALVLSKKKKKRSSQKFFRRSQKKKVFTKIFQAISTKKRFPKNFSSAPQNLTIQKIVLSSSRGQANFRGLEASRPRPRT